MRKQIFLCFMATILFLFPSFLWAATATIHWQANEESDLKEYRVYHGTASRSYSIPLPVGKVTSYTFNDLAAGVTHYFAITAVDISDNESGFSAEVSKFIPVSDTQLPQVTISSPSTSGNYTTSTSSIDLKGTASDNVGVTQVTWSVSGGGNGTASGTSSWSIGGIGLSAGQNTITVTAKDAAGNQGTAVITVTYTAPSSTSSSSTDTQPPQVTVTSPTTSGSYTTSRSKVNLAGTASDNIGVAQVTWSSSNGRSGTANGTTNWSARRITLSSGDNTITVTATDAAGNQSKAVISVIHGQSSTGDTQSPQVTITSPTASENYVTSSSSINLGGTASDNVGVTQVTWFVSGGGNGTASGTSSWSIGGIGLSAGQNTITVTAKDAAGNKGTAVIRVNYTPPSSADTQPPQVTITSPTTDASYTTSSSRITLGGSASDDVGVTEVNWSSTGGGSGTAAGTTNWSITGLRLTSGDNTITVTAKDAAGNRSTAVITVTNTARRSWWQWWRR